MASKPVGAQQNVSAEATYRALAEKETKQKFEVIDLLTALPTDIGEFGVIMTKAVTICIKNTPVTMTAADIMREREPGLHWFEAFVARAACSRVKR